MNETRRFLMMLAVFLSVGSMFVLLPMNSCAQLVVIGEGIRFTPANPRAGQTVFMDVRFRVEGSGAPVPINFSIVDATRTPDPDHPTLSGHTYAPGRSFTVNIGHRIPDPVSPRICFNVYAHFPGTGLRSAILIQNACLGAQLHLASSGTAQRVIFVRGVPAGSPSDPIPGSGSTIEIRGIDFIPLNVVSGKNFIQIVSTIHLEGDPMFLEAHLIREMRDVATQTAHLNLGNNRFEMLERIVWNEDNRIPSHIYYDIRGRMAPPIRIGGDPAPTSTESLPVLSELVRRIDLETRMYVLSEGTGQRITLPESLKILPRPGVKPVQPRL